MNDIKSDTGSAANGMEPEVVKKLFADVSRLRLCELGLANLYKEQEMRTPTHFGVGQEAVAVGVCAALFQDDVVYTHHRSHNHYLAKGGDLGGLIAELYGRERGCSRGRGGSVHLTAPDTGFIASSAILGEMIAVAAGSALAFKMDGVPRLAVAFFGDAACEEGIFYETLNYAAVHRLPVLFVCENNLYSTESPLGVRQPANTELCDRVRAFKIAARRIDGNDVFGVYRAAQSAISAVRKGEGPYFLECDTYRWLEHVGPYFDHELGRAYRSKEELEAWQAKCPVKRAEATLIKAGIIKRRDIAEMRKSIETEISNAVAVARQAAWPETSELFQDVY